MLTVFEAVTVAQGATIPNKTAFKFTATVDQKRWPVALVEFTFKVVNTGNTIMDFKITDDVNPSFVGTFFNILPGGFGSISFGVPVDSTISARLVGPEEFEPLPN